ncbi:MAG TPA: hypothetical protein VLB68_18580 [Pyrinomonadaceae bacterium]|nr:hypothetical protein [Pyrinomonadaceae bacterium]
MSTSSTFYSTYDAGQLVITGSYKGIEFDLGGGGTEFSIEEETPERESKLVEKSKSSSYEFSLNRTAGELFDVADFLAWLLHKTLEELENQNAKIGTRRHRVGRRFSVEYAQDGFVGRIEIYVDRLGPSSLTVDVEIEERPIDSIQNKWATLDR